MQAGGAQCGPAYAGIAFVFEFEMQINDDTQYRGKEAPHGKKATV